jgi:hypothetical protein
MRRGPRTTYTIAAMYPTMKRLLSFLTRSDTMIVKTRTAMTINTPRRSFRSCGDGSLTPGESFTCFAPSPFGREPLRGEVAERSAATSLSAR